MCCTRLAANIGRKKLRKNSPSAHHHTTLSGYRPISSQLRHVWTIGKNELNSHISSTCSHNMVNFGPLTAEIGWRVWGTPANFNCIASWLRYFRDFTNSIQQSVPRIHSAGRPSRWASAHILVVYRPNLILADITVNISIMDRTTRALSAPRISVLFTRLLSERRGRHQVRESMVNPSILGTRYIVLRRRLLAHRRSPEQASSVTRTMNTSAADIYVIVS